MSIILNTQYNERDAVKELKATWMQEKKCWVISDKFIDSNKNVDRFSKWIEYEKIDEFDNIFEYINNHILISPMNAIVIEGDIIDFYENVKNETYRYSFALINNHELYKKIQVVSPVFPSEVEGRNNANESRVEVHGYVFLNKKTSTLQIYATQVVYKGKCTRLTELENWEKILIDNNCYCEPIEGEGEEAFDRDKFAYEIMQENAENECKKLVENNHEIKIGLISRKGTKGYYDFKRKIKLDRFDKAILLKEYLVDDLKIENIVNKLEEINKYESDCSYVCIVRGGDHIENMHKYNHPDLAIAIRNSHIPVICGIGHAEDTFFCEYTALLTGGYNALTPTGAADKINEITGKIKKSIHNVTEKIKSNEKEQTINNKINRLCNETKLLKQQVENLIKEKNELEKKNFELQNKLNQLTNSNANGGIVKSLFNIFGNKK